MLQEKNEKQIFVDCVTEAISKYKIALSIAHLLSTKISSISAVKVCDLENKLKELKELSDKFLVAEEDVHSFVKKIKK